MARRSSAQSIWAAVAGVVLALSVGLSHAAADSLIIQGSTTFNRRLMEPHQAEIEKMTGHQLTVIPNKSAPGLISLLAGRAHMAMISAPLETEIQAVQKMTPGLSTDKLRAAEIDRVRVSFAVNRANPVRNATLAQIAKILRGEINNWKALGGADQPIRLVLVGAGGGLTSMVEAALLDGKEVSARNTMHTNTPVQLVQVVSQEPAALGFAQLALVEKIGLPELKTDKPLEQVLYLVTVGEPTPAMKSVIEAARTIAARGL